MNPQRYFLLIAVALAMAVKPSVVSARELSFDERVEAQKAIEQVYWSHRIWPMDNPGPKPPLSAAISDAAIRAKVEDYLAESGALETWWQRPITGEQLQAEMDRMAQGTRDPQILRELLAAMGNDPFVIAETLVRQTLADRLIRERYASDTRIHAKERPFDSWWSVNRASSRFIVTGGRAEYVLPAIPSTSCTNDTWTATPAGAQGRESFSAVWTGTEMIVWGGEHNVTYLNDGGRYNPALDTWTATSLGPNAPSSRSSHTAVWTGTEMIVWGGI